MAQYVVFRAVIDDMRNVHVPCGVMIFGEWRPAPFVRLDDSFAMRFPGKDDRFHCSELEPRRDCLARAGRVIHTWTSVGVIPTGSWSVRFSRDWWRQLRDAVSAWRMTLDMPRAIDTDDFEEAAETLYRQLVLVEETQEEAVTDGPDT